MHTLDYKLSLRFLALRSYEKAFTRTGPLLLSPPPPLSLAVQLSFCPFPLASLLSVYSYAEREDEDEEFFLSEFIELSWSLYQGVLTVLERVCCGVYDIVLL